MTGVVLCNLFPPYGKILAEAGPFTIALGSLEGGVRKAVNLEGLLMLSRAAVPARLALPGSFGRLLSETFRILEQLNGRKGRFRLRGPDGKFSGLAERLDALFIELGGEEAEAGGLYCSPATGMGYSPVKQPRQ
jgi:hypothetical protein